MCIPDLSPYTYNEQDDTEFMYLSVGWLGDHVEHSGKTAPELVDRLEQLREENQLPDFFRGVHTCEICEKSDPSNDEIGWKKLWEIGAVGKGEFFVQYGSTRYVLPNMIIHYITHHEYKLPKVVEDAIQKQDVYNDPHKLDHKLRWIRV